MGTSKMWCVRPLLLRLFIFLYFIEAFNNYHQFKAKFYKVRGVFTRPPTLRSQTVELVFRDILQTC